MRRTAHKPAKAVRAPDASRVLARGLLVRALRSAGIYHVLDRQASLTVIAGVTPESSGAIAGALTELVRVHGWGAGYTRNVVHDWTGTRSGSMRNRDGTLLTVTDECGDPAFVLVEDADNVPPMLAATCDGFATLGALDADLVGAAFSVVVGGRPKVAELELAATLPLQNLALALRRGRPVREIMGTVRNLLALVEEPEGKEQEETTASVPGPSLDDLHGLGEAGAWGRSLVADIAEFREGRLAWHDLDRGALLVGPPGVGKTLFVGALAATAGLPLHAHSLARWQAKGHLGDLLKALVRAFDEARAASPCILFIDEIDAVGSRDDPGDRYAAYTRQVIDALLEQLDGAVSRAGVVVVGATNHADFIDPAILRPGRLDRTIAIPLPDQAGLTGILRHHLRGALADADLGSIVERMRGFSGADVERLVRDARRAARTDRREISVGDLSSALPPAVILSDAAFRRACVHEAGHWVVGSALGMLAGMTPRSATVSRRIVNGAGGWTDFSRDQAADRTRASTIAEIAILLAGTTAEEAVIGDRGHGSGGTSKSDLHQATVAAARLVLSHGLDGGLVHILESDRDDHIPELLRDPRLRDRVEAVLAEGLDRARTIVLGRRHDVERVAAHLASGGRMVADNALDPVPNRKAGVCHARRLDGFVDAENVEIDARTHFSRKFFRGLRCVAKVGSRLAGRPSRPPRPGHPAGIERARFGKDS